MRFIGIVVALTMFLPFPGAAMSRFLHDSPFLRISAVSDTAGFLHDLTAEEGTESEDAGPSEPCLVALGECVLPEVALPVAGASIATATFSIHRAPYLPAIFRPPIG